jgi:hypothetical protein
MSVPASILPTPAAANTASAATTAASVQAGEAVEGQILRIKADLSALLMTAKGPLTLKGPASLQAGDTLKGQIVSQPAPQGQSSTQGQGQASAQNTLALQVSDHQRQGQTVRALQGQLLPLQQGAGAARTFAQAGTIPANSPALSGQSGGALPQAAGQTSAPSASPMIATARLQSAARQGTMPGLFQTLPQTATRLTQSLLQTPSAPLPPQAGTTARLGQTLNQIAQLPLSNTAPLNAQSLQKAVQSSGVFLEQKLAQKAGAGPLVTTGPAGGGTPLPDAALQQDLKANLLILKQLLGQIKQVLPSEGVQRSSLMSGAGQSAEGANRPGAPLPPAPSGGQRKVHRRKEAACFCQQIWRKIFWIRPMACWSESGFCNYPAFHLILRVPISQARPVTAFLLPSSNRV